MERSDNYGGLLDGLVYGLLLFYFIFYFFKSETRMTVSVLKQDPDTSKQPGSTQNR